MKVPRRLPLPAAVRNYATRPPRKVKDPLLSPNATHYQVAPNLTLIHRVPPTTPSPFSLTAAPSSPLLIPRPSDAPSTNTSNKLPPLLRKPREKSAERLDETQIEEMKRLRNSDPVKYTRSKLAKQFGCSPFFVPIAAPLSNLEKQKALGRREQIHEACRSRWGERKRMAVAIRQKRKELW